MATRTKRHKTRETVSKDGRWLVVGIRTAKVSLYYVTDFLLYFEFTVHYNYREISDSSLFSPQELF